MNSLRWCSGGAVLLLLHLLVSAFVVQVSEAKVGVSIPDELDDVVDDEEDEAWKEWGRKKSPPTSTEFDPPNYDFSQMKVEEIQREMLKRHSGPTFGFVKLRPGGARRRTPDEIADIATRWSRVLRTGSLEVKFMAVDLNTIMFTLERGQNTIEMQGDAKTDPDFVEKIALKDFILSQEEAYEVKIGEQPFRRDGDPPLEEVKEMLKRGSHPKGEQNSGEELDHYSDEL